MVRHTSVSSPVTLLSVVLGAALLCLHSVGGRAQDPTYTEYRTGGKMILEVYRDKHLTGDRALFTARLLNDGAGWSGYCQITELVVIPTGGVVDITSSNYRVMVDPNFDRSYFKELENISVHDSVLYFDLHRDLDHTMKMRAHYKTIGEKRFRITSLYGAELDFGLAGRRDSSSMTEWRSVDSLYIDLPFNKVR